MDTELARTFLSVISAGSFVGAAEHLHLTQSTISARIRTLEDFLRCTLFVRNKGGTSLTTAGRQFQKHAMALVRTVEQARHDVGVPDGFRASITIGGRFGLWEGFLLKGLKELMQQAPEISWRIEIGFEPDLMEGLIEGRLDLGFMYTPQSRPGLVVEHMFDEVLILVSTEEDAAVANRSYVHIDWGPEFYARYRVQFGELGGPALTANVGWLGLEHILEAGGSVYFPKRLVADHIRTGSLYRISGAPEFVLPAYAVYAADFDETTVGVALSCLNLMKSKLSF